ncbi:MAG TPA: AIR synthase related protein, partial [Gaiellaceae bacterium]|nr:AIR synthase related protein [Gaiellaceae bacterium]
QYDHIVRGGTHARPGGDAAVVRVPCERDGRVVNKLLAFSSDCNGRLCELDPRQGAAMAVAEACRNLVCAGGEPVGLTDCLNFGSPERPEIMRQFSDAVDGMADACRALSVPIVSGNVSLYNETDGRPIPPTPVAGCVGLVADVRLVPSGWQSGDAVLLATVPQESLAAEVALIRFLWKAAPLLSLCHDVGAAGVEAALAEATHWSGREADLELPAEPAAGAAVLACPPENVARLGSKGFVQIGEVR